MEDKRLIRSLSYGDIYRLLHDRVGYSGQCFSGWEMVSEYDDDGDPWEPLLYYIVEESDAEFLMRITKLPVFYNADLDLYCFGQMFYGDSPDYVPASDILTEYGVEYFEFKGWRVEEI